MSWDAFDSLPALVSEYEPNQVSLFCLCLSLFVFVCICLSLFVWGYTLRDGLNFEFEF